MRRIISYLCAVTHIASSISCQKKLLARYIVLLKKEHVLCAGLCRRNRGRQPSCTRSNNRNPHVPTSLLPSSVFSKNYLITISPVFACKCKINSSGLRRSCTPRTPALTEIHSQRIADSSTYVGNVFFIPTGEHPPRI